MCLRLFYVLLLAIVAPTLLNHLANNLSYEVTSFVSLIIDVLFYLGLIFSLFWSLVAVSIWISSSDRLEKRKQMRRVFELIAYGVTAIVIAVNSGYLAGEVGS